VRQFDSHPWLAERGGDLKLETEKRLTRAAIAGYHRYPAMNEHRWDEPLTFWNWFGLIFAGVSDVDGCRPRRSLGV
jgi:hypothetical protein